MERKVKIAAIQMKSVMKDKNYNLDKAISFIKEASKENADIVCLPELFYSGYHLNKEEFLGISEKQDGKMFQELSKVSKDLRIHIIASYPEKIDVPGVIYNSSMLIDNNGILVGNARKVYLWGEEKLSFREGDKFTVFNTILGKIGILICYDNEFPEPPRIMALKGAELIFVPSVWSMVAKHRWDIDLKASSLYNLLFTVGVNTIDNGACGNSKIVNPRGELLAEASLNNEEIIYSSIDLKDVVRTRGKIPYLQDFKNATFDIKAVEKF